jgi:hypothetical protein
VGNHSERKGGEKRIPIERSRRTTNTRGGCSPKAGCFGPWAAVDDSRRPPREAVLAESSARHRETDLEPELEATGAPEARTVRIAAREENARSHRAPPRRSGRNAVKWFVHRRHRRTRSFDSTSEAAWSTGARSLKIRGLHNVGPDASLARNAHAARREPLPGLARHEPLQRRCGAARDGERTGARSHGAEFFDDAPRASTRGHCPTGYAGTTEGVSD